MKSLWILLLSGGFVFGVEEEISAVDTLFVIASSALVLLMTPALGLFYAGMVNRNNP